MQSNRSENESNAKSVLVLVCTYNERANVERLVEAINHAVQNADILVIDDSSPDGTGEFVKSLIESKRFGEHLKLKSRPGKQGLGSAIRNGLKVAMDERYDLVVNLDADFSHDPAIIPSVINAMDSPNNDCVDLAIGSRYVHGGGMVNCSWKRKLVSKLANAYARMLLGWRIRDCSSAFRCYRVEALRTLPWDRIQCEGYGFLEEILWYLLHPTASREKSKTLNATSQSGIVVEVPIIYTERALGDSKISAKEATGTLSVIHRLWRIRLGLQ